MASYYQTTGTLTRGTVRSGASWLLSCSVTNAATGTRWFQIHDKASLPTAGDVPTMFLALPEASGGNPRALTLGSDMLGDQGFVCHLGLSWAISTTAGTFTDAAVAADHTVSLRYAAAPP